MHINWKTKVVLPSYSDAELNAALQRRVQAATDDDLLSSFLHYAEGWVALSAYEDFDRLLTVLKDEEADSSKLRGDDDSPLRFEYLQAHHQLQRELTAQVAEAQRVRGEVGSGWHALRTATTGELNRRYQLGADPAESGLDAIGPLLRALDPMWLRLEESLKRHADLMHELALKDADYQAFAATPESITLEQFNGMTPMEFEQAVANLTHRDGYIVDQRHGGARDLGADVIATTPDGRRIVFQCKHRRPGGRPLGSPVIQTLNGTARPVHNANIVIAVTNASFTTPAHELAAEQDIHLLFGERLRTWSTWGVPLLTALGLEAPPAAAAA
ncbi:restriction endonuclease [Streptomyces sp. NPDC058286]|uniref:restriction endonuclease n=1 Tax=Streptomyces sp. NPDC058286 TaxID=3346422 RepID=UPI0036E26D31